MEKQSTKMESKQPKKFDSLQEFGEDYRNNLKLTSNEVEIRNTPFKAIRKENEKWILVIGRYQVLKEEFDTFGNILNILKVKKWEIMSNLVFILADIRDEIIKEQKKQQKEKTNQHKKTIKKILKNEESNTGTK